MQCSIPVAGWISLYKENMEAIAMAVLSSQLPPVCQIPWKKAHLTRCVKKTIQS